MKTELISKLKSVNFYTKKMGSGRCNFCISTFAFIYLWAHSGEFLNFEILRRR